jgi:hypothetical protein
MNRKTFDRKIPILLLFLFLATVLVTSFHHHADMRNHSNCASCKVIEVLSANDTPQIFQIPLPQQIEGLIDHEVINIRPSSFIVLQHSRAPPENSFL